MEILWPRVVLILVILFALLLLVLLKWVFFEGFSEADAFKDGVLCLWMEMALLANELLEVILLVSWFLPAFGAVDRRDCARLAISTLSH